MFKNSFLRFLVFKIFVNGEEMSANLDLKERRRQRFFTRLVFVTKI